MMINYFLRSALFAAALLAVVAPATPLAAQSAETEYEGAAALGLSLRRLGATQRVLMIAAHPDDENTAVLSALALGAGADVAYLSLTRGEGGQNGIGPELQEALGVIRTEELLAARRLDGAQQFFARAYDYGFSKSAEEAFQHWPADSILADVVAVIRRFRPDLVIAIFGGTPADGHGQHQAAGIMAREAFTAAGDPARFPEQLADGLRAHQPTRFFQAHWRGGDTGGVTLQTGTFDPLLGRSYHQIALASRGRHRSQDMGRALTPGPHQVLLQRMDGEHVGAASLFAGLDTTLSARARGLVGAAQGGAALVALLTEYDDAIPALRARFNPLAAAGLVPELARLVSLLERAELSASTTAAPPAALAELRFHLAAELDDARAALARAAGIVVDAVASHERVVPGQSFEVALTAWNGGAEAVLVESLEPALPAGWTAALIPAAGTPAAGSSTRGSATGMTTTGAPAGTATGDSPAGKSVSDDSVPTGTTLAPGTLLTQRYQVHVPADAAATEPYYLRAPRAGDIYRWPADPALRGLPFEPAPVRARARVAVAGAKLALSREVQYQIVSSTEGEFRRPVQVTPAVSVSLHPTVAVLPIAPENSKANGGPSGSGTPPRPATGTATALLAAPAAAAPTLRFSVELTTDNDAGMAGTLRLLLPAGWTATPAILPVHLETPGERQRFDFQVAPPAGVAAGAVPVRALFETAAGARYDRGYDLVDYPHIRARSLYHEAETTVQVFDVRVRAGLRVAYIPGAGDAIPDALAQLGIPVTTIDPADLAVADLDAFQTIVLGIRAYEHQPEIARQNRRLLEFVERGGTLIVQYNQYRFSGGGFTPYPLTIARPHDRVTDETAAVRLLDAAHPALAWPNRITARDFEGWIQERGLYFAHSWDERYTPLLALSDPGEDPLHGGLLVARYGKGTYVYTGLAFFRQLPAGVPGAYRLFANLVSLGARE